MAMSVATLDILEGAQFPPAQARALARVFEAEFMARREELATKSDLSRLEQSMKAEWTEFRHAMKTELAALRADFAQERQAIKADLAESRSLTKEQIADAKTDMVRWTLLAMMSFASLAATAVYFVMQNLR